MRTLIASTILVLTGLTATAEERLDRMMIRGGVICDTRELLEEHLLTGPSSTIEGCGRLSRGMWADVYLTDIFETTTYRFAMARYEFPMDRDGDGELDEMWVQYGFWGSPQVIPARLDT